MKKIIFVFAMFCAMSFAACGNKTADVKAADSTSVDTVEVVDSIEAVDSVAADSVCND
jgi:hypothetical protein